MRELTELLAQKEGEFKNLTQQIENVTKEIDALRTTMRLLEQAATTRSGSGLDSVKRPAASVKNESSAVRESAVAELP